MRDLDGEGIPGRLFEGGSRGIVFGPGLLGNRHGLEDVAVSLSQELNATAVVVDPPGHHKHPEEFSFGAYAQTMRDAVNVLRGEYGVDEVFGVGHSAGAAALVFAQLGYDWDVEGSVCSGDMVVGDHGLVFDKLVLASLPNDMRSAIPHWLFHRPSLWVVQRLFHMQNKTGSENYTDYFEQDVPKWKHLRIPDLFEARTYSSRIVNPDEYIEEIEKLPEGRRRVELFHETPSLVVVPGRDIVNFGPKVYLGIGPSAGEMDACHKMVGVLGSKMEYLPRAAHFLNSVDKFEGDSLYGLRSRSVQQRIADFLS